tara:strand:+ start:433 stop:585 length:153 start_codon:yes stop_codon:yes gene_type:complete
MLYQLIVVLVIIAIIAAVYYYMHMNKPSAADRAKTARKVTGNESFCSMKH